VSLQSARALIYLFLLLCVDILSGDVYTFKCEKSSRRFDHKRIDDEKSVENVEDEWSRK
jgi:hypothetical protein